MSEGARLADNGYVANRLAYCPPAASGTSRDMPTQTQIMASHGTVSDDALMSRVRDDEVQTLAMLFDRHHAALFNFFLRTTGNRASSDDLVQDVFVRILKYRRTYRPGTRFLTWMYRVARNARLDYLQKRSGEIEWDDAYLPPVSPEDPAEAVQRQKWLALALQRLPDDKREVLVLSRFQGLRYETIAQLLNCETGAVKVRVHRAMRELREEFERIAQGKGHEQPKRIR